VIREFSALPPRVGIVTGAINGFAAFIGVHERHGGDAKRL